MDKLQFFKKSKNICVRYNRVDFILTDKTPDGAIKEILGILYMYIARKHLKNDVKVNWMSDLLAFIQKRFPLDEQTCEVRLHDSHRVIFDFEVN